MAGPEHPNSSSSPPSQKRLDSWKEIAAFLNRGVRTVQRWEQEEGLPVHRLTHEKRGTVHAYQEELDTWWLSRVNQLGEKGSEASEARPAIQASRRWLLVTGVSVACLAAAVLVWRVRGTSSVLQGNLTPVTMDAGNVGSPALSFDGKMIAYLSDRDKEGSPDLWIQQIQGGRAARVAKGPAFDPVFSPDGTRILFSRGQPQPGIYEVAALGGDPKMSVSNGTGARFSPDGRWMSYIASPPMPGLFLMDSSTGGTREVVTGLDRIDRAIWSADSKRLLVLGTGGGDLDWWVIEPESGKRARTGAVARLGSETITTPYPVLWLMDDQVVYWCVGSKGAHLWRVGLSSSDWHVAGEPNRLTTDTAEESPAAGFAAGRLVFSSGSFRMQLWLLPADVNHGRALGPVRRLNHGGLIELYPSVSGDGKKLALGSEAGGNLNVFLRDLESGQETALASRSERQQYVTITRDGTRVAYGTVVQSSKRPVFVVAAAGGLPKKICDDCGRPSDWSPDGVSIVLSRIAPPRNRIALLDVATGRSTDVLASLRWSLGAARFSPNGKWMAFLASDSSGIRVVIAPVRGAQPVDEKEWITVTQLSDRAPGPFWSPNGDLVYFSSANALKAEVFEPSTGRLSGQSSTVYQFQEGEILNRDPFANSAAVAMDKIIFVMSEIRGNIWTMDYKPRR